MKHATFEGPSVAVERADFYVYILFRETGVPFYVGYGSNGRWLVHETQARAETIGRKANRYKIEIIRKMQARGVIVPKVKIHAGLTAAAAKAYEAAFIAAIGRHDLGTGPLANLTPGGDGVVDPTPETRKRMGASNLGRTLSLEHRKKVAASHLGKRRSPEAIARMSAAQRGRTLSPEHRASLRKAHLGKTSSPEHRAKIAAAHRGKPKRPEAIEKTAAGLRGRKHTPEAIARMSAAHRGKKQSPETIAKRAASHRGQKRSLETRAKMAAAQLGKTHTPETRAKLSAATRRTSAARRKALSDE
jgi:NUMOD3 motif